MAAAVLLASCGYLPSLTFDTAPEQDRGVGSAAAALEELPVKGRAPKTGYAREHFGPDWTDDVSVNGGHNGCDTRNDLLRRSLSHVIVKPETQGCVVLSGLLDDPYTGRQIGFTRGPDSADVQVEHVVALADSWQKGAQQLTLEERTNLANDPLGLVAIDGPTNSAKGDSDAASWLPPHEPYRCRYIARQIAVKRTYRLWITAAEKHAMRSVLVGCPGEPLPTPVDADVAIPTPAP